MFSNTNTTAKTQTKAKKPGVLFDLLEVTETTDATTGELKKSFKNIVPLEALPQARHAARPPAQQVA